MKRISRGEFNSNPRTAYMGFLFETFFKRPFAYIIAVLYLLYLMIILLIVPATIKQEPLFIWNMSTFNMPIFNLFFISAATSSIAVTIFRVGREDGTDLSLSAKPLTKGSAVGIKTLTYLLIILMFCAISLIIVALIRPIFGVYNLTTNPTGVETSKYFAILVSIFVGNIVNMCLFGGVSVFICMVGGQVITMIGTIGLAFVMCLLNFVYPQIATSPNDVIEDTFNSSILSFRANTRAQYEHPEDAVSYSYASIQCHLGDNYEEILHLETNDTWKEAQRQGKTGFINYIDFGKQLSNLYVAFGLESMKLEDAKQLYIGANTQFNYDILDNTHVGDPTNIGNGNYPIGCYERFTSQGKTYPKVRIIGGDVGKFETTNWYIQSKYREVDFDSVCVVSKNPEIFYHPTEPEQREKFGNKLWVKLDKDLVLNDQETAVATDLFNQYINETVASRRDFFNTASVKQAMNNVFYDGTWENLQSNEDWTTMFNTIARIHYFWALKAQDTQNNIIQQWLETQHPGEEHKFPFTSKEYIEWSDHIIEEGTDKEKEINEDIQWIFDGGFFVNVGSGASQPYYSKLVTSTMSVAETFANLYQYNVTNFYSIYAIVTAWSLISVILLASSIIVYKRTDFK